MNPKCILEIQFLLGDNIPYIDFENYSVPSWFFVVVLIRRKIWKGYKMEDEGCIWNCLSWDVVEITRQMDCKIVDNSIPKVGASLEVMISPHVNWTIHNGNNVVWCILVLQIVSNTNSHRFLSTNRFTETFLLSCERIMENRPCWMDSSFGEGPLVFLTLFVRLGFVSRIHSLLVYMIVISLFCCHFPSCFCTQFIWIAISCYHSSCIWSVLPNHRKNRGFVSLLK